MLCMHSGLSPDLTSFDQVINMIRPTYIPDYGLLKDLLNSEPDASYADWCEVDKGGSLGFGPSIISKFC
jgi:serine/threonine-protein phosphatase PP1 catalytic subunit